jgi:triacylglycerol lipase
MYRVGDNSLMDSKISIWVLDYAQAFVWHLQGLTHRRSPARFIRSGLSKAKPPILIIPGVYEPWNFMSHVIQFLYDHGYSVHAIEVLGYNVGEIAAAATKVSDYIIRHNLHEVILVGHSKGGIIGKYVMDQLPGGQRVNRLIAVSSPFSGSKYARLLPFRAVREFAATSKSVVSSQKLTASTNRTVSIYGSFDPLIPERSYLPGATNIELPVTGHFRILNNPKVLQAILLNLT